MASNVEDLEEGRGLLAEVTATLESDVDELDPRRVALREWLAAHPNPLGRELADAKLVAPAWPEPWGLNASLEYQIIIDDELRRAGVRRPINPIGIGWAGPTIVIAGTEAQRQRWLPKLLSGEEFWCQLFSEPNAGSDLASLTTSARARRRRVGRDRPEALDELRASRVVGHPARSHLESWVRPRTGITTSSAPWTRRA